MKGCAVMQEYTDQEFVDEYGFPIEFPETVLANMRGALNISEDVFRNLHDYFDAASNLYARIPLRMLYEIYNSQNPPISEDDFLDAAEVISHGRNHYTIVPRKVFYPDSPETELELVAEHLYALGDDEYYKVEQAQADKKWYIPIREDFLKYSDSFYTEETPQLLALTNFLRNTQKKLRCPPLDVTEELVMLFRLDQTLQEILNDARRFGVSFQTQADLRLFIKLCLDLSHHTRRYIHNGHTPAELGLPRLSLDEAMATVTYDEHWRDPLADLAETIRTLTKKNPAVSGKPARNAPCPCGSGRKYKNCCGK